jgi:hypothetical protein
MAPASSRDVVVLSANVSHVPSSGVGVLEISLSGNQDRCGRWYIGHDISVTLSRCEFSHHVVASNEVTQRKLFILKDIFVVCVYMVTRNAQTAEQLTTAEQVYFIDIV